MDLAKALAQCADEPIHVPGAIQPAGMLMVLDQAGDRVLQASTNLADWAGVAPTALCGSRAGVVLGRNGATRLRRALRGRDRLRAPLMVAPGRRARQEALRITAWRTEAGIVTELEPAVSNGRADDYLVRLNALVSELDGTEHEERLLQTLTDRIRALTGHDRVKVYAFDEEWHGTVVAESRIPEMNSYLGHRFPASDIPPQARAMYARNAVRIIPDVNAAPVPIEPANSPVTGKPLDIGEAVFRAVSPIHLQYLHNMGVRASLSIAIRKAGVLWGLVACHSRDPRHITPEIREAAVGTVAAASQRLFILQREAEETQRREFQAFRRGLIRDARPSDSAGAILQRKGSELLRLFACSGVVLLAQNETTAIARVPAQSLIDKLVEHLAERHPRTFWATNEHSDLPVSLPIETGCGLLAVPLNLRNEREWLLLFRREKREQIVWAGNPDKPLEAGTDDGTLSPRRSFEEWHQVVEGRAEPWEPAIVEAAHEIAHDLAVIASANEIRILNERLKEEQIALTIANTRLTQEAETDGLTGVWNRGRMTRELAAEMQRVVRYARTFSFLMLDVDHFKSINDRFGHDVGDRVLRTVASRLSSNMRDVDRFARWGGEEFAVLATDIELEGALELGERLRKTVEEIDMPQVGRTTISVGVATWHAGDTLDSLYRRADQGLYAAKQSGRNRVCGW